MQIIQIIQMRNISALKGLDHEVGIDHTDHTDHDLSEVCTLVLLFFAISGFQRG